jgi:hypothetical protein
VWVREVTSVVTREVTRLVTVVVYPTDTPTPTATATPTSTPTVTPTSTSGLAEAETTTDGPQGTPGLNRARPFPAATRVSAPNWELEVLEVLRGDEAWEALEEASRYNDPAAEGWEYVLVKLWAKCTYEDEEEHRLRPADFDLTGSALRLYSYAGVREPDPELDARLYEDGETTGWVAFEVQEDEQELILVFDELDNWEDDSVRYLALEEGASISVDPDLADVAATDEGISRKDPLPMGEPATTDDWQATLLEVLRGDEAWETIREANRYTDPAAKGTEYVLARIAVRNISIRDAAASIGGSRFRATGSNNILYEYPWISGVEPALDAELFPGGEAEGWVVAQVSEDEGNMMLRFSPSYDFRGENTRFLALEEDASVAVDPDLDDIEPNGLGESRSEPAPLGETVVSEDWEITLLESLRGDEAWETVQTASRFNDEPDDGMEYVLVRLQARYIGSAKRYRGIGESHCKLSGESDELRDAPSLTDPQPAFGADLYPGGETAGWATFQAEEGEEDLVLVVTPPYESGRQARYLALE